MILDALRRKRCETLHRKGYARVRGREFDAALEIATKLEMQRYSGAFEIAALAHAGKGDLEAAVAVLRRGVATAPDVWLNWQLLGNYVSDLERYEEAEAAYERALACPGASQDSVRLNLAVLAGRRDRPAAALTLLDELKDPALVAPAREIRTSCLRALGRMDEALALANDALEGGPPDDEEGAARWERIAATAGRIRLEQKTSNDDVRRWVLDCLQVAPAGRALLRLLRDIEGRHSPSARHFEIIVHGAIPLRSPMRKDVAGFFVTCGVAADSAEQALGFVRELEQLENPEDPANLSIDSSSDLGPASDEPLGVIWRFGRGYYERED